MISEQVSRVKTFPVMNINNLKGKDVQTKTLKIPNTQIELKSDSVYYSIL